MKSLTTWVKKARTGVNKKTENVYNTAKGGKNIKIEFIIFNRKINFK